jgi:CO/xanthine dehydrogenase FAD-binding subunit
VCHVVPKGRNCVAAMSSDNVPVLISLDASIVLVGPEGRRELALEDYYHADGIAHTLAKARAR